MDRKTVEKVMKQREESRKEIVLDVIEKHIRL